MIRLNHAVALELAGLPDLVRGYEDIKPTNVERCCNRLDEVVRRLQ